MGCTQSSTSASSKNKSRRAGQDINFKRTGAVSIDRFFDEVKDLVKTFDDISEPVEDAIANFYDVSLFYEVPCASNFLTSNRFFFITILHIGMKAVFCGIITSLSSLAGVKI